MCKLALIGDPVEKALSPVIQNAMLKALGRKEVYGRFQLSQEELPAWIKSEKAHKLMGFNVTMPLKRDIIPYMAELSLEASNMQAVNTVVRRNGKLYGYNTDGIGFVRALKSVCKDISSLKIVLIGSGGAAYAVAESLFALCQSLTVYCRKPEDTHFAENIALMPFASLENAKTLKEYDIIINATPLGMYGYKEFDSLVFLDFFKKRLPCL